MRHMRILAQRGPITIAGVLGMTVALGVGCAVFTAFAAPLTPLQEAVAYAYALRVAGSDFDAARVVKALLGRLKVPILPNTYAGVGVGINDFQVDIVAKAFREGKLTKLDAIANEYAVEGVSFGGPQETAGTDVVPGAGIPGAGAAGDGAATAGGAAGAGGADAAAAGAAGSLGTVKAPWTSLGPTQSASGFFLEKGLRDLRQAAEKAKQDSDTFSILIMDALGRREEHPMDLMKVHEPGCADKAEGQPLFPGVPGGPTAEGVMKEMLAAALESEGKPSGAKADPADQKVADALMGMVAQQAAAAGGAGAGGAAAGGGSGTPGTAGIAAAISSAAGVQLQQALSKAGSGLTLEGLLGMRGQARAKLPPLPGDATPAQRRLYEAMKKQAADVEMGADADTLGKDGEDMSMYARDLEKETVDRLGAEGTSLGAKVREENDKDVPADVASEQIGNAMYGLWDARDRAEDRYVAKDYTYSQVRDQQDEIRRETEEKKNLRMSVPLPNLTGSCLWLDAVQVLILQISVFDLDKAALILPVEEGVLK